VTPLGAEERLEDPGQRIRGDAGPVIAHLDADVSAGHESHGTILSGLSDLEIAGRDCDGAVFTDGFDGVLDDLDEGLLELGLVEFHGVEALGELALPAGAGGRGLLETFNDAPQDRVELPWACGGGSFPGG